MTITANTSVSGKKFKIELKREKTQTKIVLYQRDSTSKLDQKDNSKLDSIKEQILKSDKISAEIYDLVDSLVEKYEHYTKDSILVGNTHKVIQLMNSVYHESNTELEKSIEARKNGTSIGLDGTTVKVEIKDSQSFRRIGFWSPRKDSHPIIYNLMKESLEYYRSQDPKILKTKKETSGY